MELTVSSWFNEVGINFKISHKVNLYIRKEIKENIMAPLGLLTSHDGKFLNLNVTTEKDRTELHVHIARNWTKRTTNRSHGLWFPYHPIIDSEYPLKEYLAYYMASLNIIFKEFGVTTEQLEKVQKNCELEILNNKEYEYVEGYVSKVDTSKYDF